MKIDYESQKKEKTEHVTREEIFAPLRFPQFRRSVNKIKAMIVSHINSHDFLLIFGAPVLAVVLLILPAIILNLFEWLTKVRRLQKTQRAIFYILQTLETFGLIWFLWFFMKNTHNFILLLKLLFCQYVFNYAICYLFKRSKGQEVEDEPECEQK